MYSHELIHPFVVVKVVVVLEVNLSNANDKNQELSQWCDNIAQKQ